MNQSQNKPTVAFLMGPTACGKTDLAIYLHQNFPVDIISVDSALIYRGMDIGTAKPTAQELAQAPHRLIDIRDPAETYSVAQFCQDVQREVESIVAQGRVPLLVGGTMMYYKSLLEGLADMPATDPCIREQIVQEAQQKGWPAMHQQLMQVDPSYGQKIHPNHSQRIGRALEVYRSSGKTMSQCLEAQAAENDFAQGYQIKQFALLPDERSWLHERIKKRYLMMLEQGFVGEVVQLKQRGDLHLDLPSMRCVGYRQVWQYLENEFSYEEMVDKGMAATRQLAKRQLTWLRSWPDLLKLSAGAAQNKKIISEALNF